MSSEGTLKVHRARDQPPLLRRPRPPKALTAPPKANDHHMHRTSPRKLLHGHYIDSTTPSTHCTHDVHIKTDFSIHPLYPKGPSFFSPGKKMVACHGGVYLPPLYDNESKSIIGDENYNDSMNFEPLDSSDDFTLADFQMVASQQRIISPNVAKVISRQNYLKLTGWFAVNVPTQKSLNTTELDAALESPQERKPRHQVLLELQSMVDEALMAASSGVSVKEEEEESWEVMEPPDMVIGSSVSRYFCGQRRSRSPFRSSDQPEISPSELAILDCMLLSGGRRLDLKAHFLSQLPDLSPLAKTLTYLNLSFNCLNVFPVEVLQLSQLVCLQLRNNPIKEIPNDIRKLTRLRVLCLSFNLLSDLPSGLIDLQSLCDLDLSYNTFNSLPRHISMLMNLRKLNVEGNQLIGVPSTMMTLPLTHLLVGDNLMHPVLWVENSRNQPQDLVDLCSMLVSKCVSATDDPRLPEQVISVLQRSSGQRCDHCQCPLYGCGLRVICSVGASVLGIINLPFVFLTCSPSCRTSLKQRTKWRLPFQSKTL